MRLFGKDLDADVAIVAEIGVNHEGSAAEAEALIRLAAEAGACAVKFQTYTPERYASASNPERLAQVTRFCLDRSMLARLAEVARSCGLGFFSTPLTEDVVELVAGLGDAVKVASGDVVFEPTIRAAARTGKPVLVSTGNATVEEIDRTVQWCREEIGQPLSDRLILLHCVAAYPTPVDQANVRSVPFLRDRYRVTVGYSSHVIEPEAVFAAVALGARVVEVHFPDRRDGRTFRDHQLSYDPASLRQLVDSARRVAAALGSYGKAPAEAEIPARALMRKGVVAARELAAGRRIERDDLMFARPATAIPASDVGSVVGRTLTTQRRRGEQIRLEDLA
jgi:N,N'-diacetyllegionaminate synthase